MYKTGMISYVKNHLKFLYGNFTLETVVYS